MDEWVDSGEGEREMSESMFTGSNVGDNDAAVLKWR